MSVGAVVGASVEEAAEQAAAEADPQADLNASVEYRTHLAKVLTRRALEAASGLTFLPSEVFTSPEGLPRHRGAAIPRVCVRSGRREAGAAPAGEDDEQPATGDEDPGGTDDAGDLGPGGRKAPPPGWRTSVEASSSLLLGSSPGDDVSTVTSLVTVPTG